MFFYSLNNKQIKNNFREAAILGQAPDKGLYFPEYIPQLSPKFFKEITNYSKKEIALEVIKPYVGDTIPLNILDIIVDETIDFDFPLIKIEEDIFSLELFHGPTLAFKDVGARFMSRCLSYFVKNNDKKLTVLVATSGDTGGAVANGFYNVDGVDVIILYPSGKVSSIQELQLTTLGKNITALEINGNFDDCQQLVKQAFTDTDLNKKLFLTSANSINIARWLPQQFYYFFAYQQWDDKNNPPVISVPSGNFGNISAGLLAQKSGLPVKHFIAACNANKSVPEFLLTGKYDPKKAIATISNAMDVGDPSNFVRVLEILGKDIESIKDVLSGYSITDAETKQEISEVNATKNYLLDPHGAVAYLSLKKYLQNHPNEKGIFLETAHPIKFYDVIEEITKRKIDVNSFDNFQGKTKTSIKMEVDYDSLKQILLEKN